METVLKRNSRKNLIGTVTSRSGDKTIKVTYFYKIPHPLYRKEIKRKTVLHVHDENCLLYTSPSPRDMRRSRMPSSA